MEQKIQLSRYRTNDLGITKKTNSYIPNASDNLFSNYLNGLYTNSPTHQCIVDDLTGYTVGLGLEAESDEDTAKLNEFFNKRDLSKIVKTKFIQNEIDLEVLRDALSNVKSINCIDPSQLRVHTLKDNVPSSFAYRKDWNPRSMGHTARNSAIIPAYDIREDRSILSWRDSGVFDVPYGRPCYISGTDPIELEISIYAMHNHGAQNGMFPSMLIAKETSGDTEKDKEDTILTQKQVSGVANAGKMISTYYPQGGTAPVFTTPNLTGLDKIYENQYATAEAGILKAWRIPSPTLISGLNVKSTGFGNAEEEMQWAKNELMSKIIEPQREEILDILQPLFEALDITTEVSFKEPENKNVQKVEIDEKVEETELSEVNLLDEFISTYGEDKESFKDWEIESIVDVDYDLEDQLDAEIERLNSSFVTLVSTGVARPAQKSSQDGTKGNKQYKVRYEYVGDTTSKSRDFCSTMINAGKLYRKEDIIQMSFSNVNKGFGIKGANNYNIFNWKGGIYCHHKWQRVTFVKEGLEGGIDVRSPIAKVSETTADGMGINPENNKLVETKPIDTPNRGRYTFNSILTRLKKWQ